MVYSSLLRESSIVLIWTGRYAKPNSEPKSHVRCISQLPPLLNWWVQIREEKSKLWGKWAKWKYMKIQTFGVGYKLHIICNILSILVKMLWQRSVGRNATHIGPAFFFGPQYFSGFCWKRLSFWFLEGGLASGCNSKETSMLKRTMAGEQMLQFCTFSP